MKEMKDNASPSSSSSSEKDVHMFTRRRSLEKFVLYETKTRYYLVGHTNCRKEWYLMQISRQTFGEVHCDKTRYTENQIKLILASVSSAMEHHGGMRIAARAYGVVGFVSLLRNAYLILVTHRKKVGTIAGHRVYGCRDVAYVPIISKEFITSQQLTDKFGPFTNLGGANVASSSSLSTTTSSYASSRGSGGGGGGSDLVSDFRLQKRIKADEKRYLRLFMGVDLCKDFYFSYTYPLWNSLQQNLLLDTQDSRNSSGSASGSISGFENMFVWNAHLANNYFDIEKQVSESDKERWIVPLIQGFFDQVKLCTFGKELKITLVARRSRYFAGTRFLKRGINDLGQVANEVETEQIVEAQLDRDPRITTTTASGSGRDGGRSGGGRADTLRLSSIVQVRGSIPLYWSQETSTSLNPRPEIRIRRYDPSYRATKEHFDSLHQRYGKPVIVLNLIKSYEKRPREMILRVEFAQAVDYLNKFHYKRNGNGSNKMGENNEKEKTDAKPQNSSEQAGSRSKKTGGAGGDEKKGSELLFVHWDFSKCTKQRGVNVLGAISPVVTSALKSTGLFYTLPSSESKGSRGAAAAEENAAGGGKERSRRYKWAKQQGVLRTNCIDCLDRTNVAQFAYGLHALSYQMHVLGITDSEERSYDGVVDDWEVERGGQQSGGKPAEKKEKSDGLGLNATVNKINPRSIVATELMNLYEAMGDCIALQYGGSEAHSKFFKRQKGSWEATTQSQDMMTSFRRFYSNTYTDAAKQAAINLFLGHFVPKESPAHIWELESDSYLPNLYYHRVACEPEWKRKKTEMSQKGQEEDDEVVCNKSSRTQEEEDSILGTNLGMLWREERNPKRAVMVSIDKVISLKPLLSSFNDFLEDYHVVSSTGEDQLEQRQDSSKSKQKVEEDWTYPPMEEGQLEMYHAYVESSNGSLLQHSLRSQSSVGDDEEEEAEEEDWNFKEMEEEQLELYYNYIEIQSLVTS